MKESNGNYSQRNATDRAAIRKLNIVISYFVWLLALMELQIDSRISIVPDNRTFEDEPNWTVAEVILARNSI